MTRQEAFQTLQVYTKSQNLIRHHLATEAAMKAIGQRLIERKVPDIDLEMWGITGLLHDADYEMTRNDPASHTLVLEDKLRDVLPPEVIHAIKAHNYKYTGIQPRSYMDWALYACDELTGFVIACALIVKGKKIGNVDVDFIMKKMQERSFAKSVDRQQIYSCDTMLGFMVPDFIQIVLNAMTAIANDLGFDG